MADVFISYAGEDHEVVMPVVRALESAGYSAWYYERDCPPFASHLDATGSAIRQARVVALIVSPYSVASHEVDSEVQWAHRVVRPVAPILVDIGWDELETRQPLWCRIIGTGVGINIQRTAVEPSVPRILAGLEALGIPPPPVAPPPAPAVPPAPPPPVQALPHPLAALIERQAALPATDPRAQQRGLVEAVEAAVQYLASIAVEGYRQASIEPGSEDPEVKQRLKDLLPPTFGGWLDALDLILHNQRFPREPLFEALDAFYTARHENDAIAAAYLKIQEWLNFRPRRRPPFSYADLFAAVGPYRDSLEEAAGGAATDEGGASRVAVLRPAVDALLKDLAFLAGYPLVAVGLDRRAWDAMAGQLTLRSGPLGGEATPEAGHVYLCRSEGGNLAPFLDLGPLAVAMTCAQCRELRVFGLAAGAQGAAEYRSAACGHALPLATDRERAKALAAYLSTARRRPPEPPPPELPFVVLPEHQPYMEEFREILKHGEPSAEQRDYLDTIARLNKLAPEVCRKLEEIVRAEKVHVDPVRPPHALDLPPEGAARSLDEVMTAARTQAADLGMLGIDSTFLFAVMLKQGDSATVKAFDRLGLPAGLFSTLLASLEDSLAPLRRTSKHTDPTLSASVEAIVKLAQKLAAASNASPTETHLLEAFVLHRKNGIMRLLAEFEIEPERLLPGPWLRDGVFDESRFSEPVLTILREALRRAETSRMLGSPQLLAAVATNGSDAARKRLGIPADGVAGYVSRMLDKASMHPDRPRPTAITWDLCSARAERILNLAELLAREAGSAVQEGHLVEAITRTQSGS